MSNATVFGLAQTLAAKAQTIYNVVSPVGANTEFSQVLSAGTKQLLIRVRGTAKLQYTFTTGESGSKFITIPRSNTRHISSLDLPSGATIYMQVDKASQTVEIEEWV